MAYGFRYRDRREAGKALARALAGYAAQRDLVVLALPRGGVPVGYEVAKALHAPLDIFTVRKLGVPGQPELAMGAVASGGVAIVDERMIRGLSISDSDITAAIERETAELRRREAAYRDHRTRAELCGKTVLLVDDGLATGASMRAAIEAVRERDPERVVVAVPVGAPDTVRRLRSVADEVVCVLMPDDLVAVGAHYEDFNQTTDDEVRTILNEADEEQRRWNVA